MELKKGSIDYEKTRSGYVATAEEKEYIKNDVLILKKVGRICKRKRRKH